MTTSKKNRLPLDAIMACLADYAEACRSEGEARADYDGYSWDYHGSRYIEAVEDAQKDAEKELEAYIDACVSAETEKLYRLISSIDPDLSRLEPEQQEICKEIFAWCKSNPKNGY